MKCKKHKEVETSEICSACGLAKCEDCLIEVLDKLVCKDCLKKGEVGVDLMPKLSNANEWTPKKACRIYHAFFFLTISVYLIFFR